MIDCEDIIKKAIGRDMTDAEIDGMFDQAKLLKEQAEARARANGSLPDILNLTRDWTKKEELAALAKKRNTLLQIQKRAQILNYCLTEFKGMEAEGIQALQVGSHFSRAGARQSADEMGNALGMSYIGQLLTDLGGLKGAHYDLFRKNGLGREISEALFLMETPEKYKGPPEAMAIAEAIHKVQERARTDANMAGAWIGKLPGYIVRQSHDPAKLNKLGYAEWKKEIEPRLDWTRMLDGKIDPQANPQAAEKFLSETWKALANGHHIQHTHGQNPLVRTAVIGSQAARMSHERVLHFKSGGDWFDYNAKFGRGGLNEAVIFGLRQSGESTALMRVFGPSPQATLGWVAERLSTILQNRGDNAGVQRVMNMRKRFNDNMAILDGSENIDGNIRSAAIGRNVRAWQSMIRLGGALISSISDVPNVGFEFAYQGSGFFKGMAKNFYYFLQGRPSLDQQRVAASCGVFFDSMIGSVSSRFSSDGMTGKMAAGMNLFFKLNGLSFWTDAWKKSAVLAMSHDFAQLRGTAFDQLGKARQRLLGLYGIDQPRWELLRKAATTEADGREYLTPDGVRGLEDSRFAAFLQRLGKEPSEGAIRQLREELATQLQTLYRDRVHYAVLEPDAANRRLMHQGTAAGTVTGELMRYIMQFKSFPTSFVQRTMGREIYGRGADSIKGGLKQIFARSADGDRSNFLSMAAAMTAMGVLAMQAKAIVAGKTPREFFAKDMWYKTLSAGALQGGGLGILGDFLFADYSRYGTTALGSALGPAANDIDAAFRIFSRIKQGDIDLGPELFRQAMSHIPGNNLFYVKAALDYGITHQINEWLRPGYINRMKRRIWKENRQTFWLDPER